MLSLEVVYQIAAAAEGSQANRRDVRYQLSVANAKSGFSFGIFQFDCAHNTQAQSILNTVLTRFSIRLESQQQLASIRNRAQLINPMKSLTTAEFKLLSSLFEEKYTRDLIDFETEKYARNLTNTLNALIECGRNKWASKKEIPTNALAIFIEGKPEHLHLFAYLLATYNRRHDIDVTFKKWVQGEPAVTANSPPGGWQLTAPPTLDDMHAFFKSLKMWDGTQGKYENLRARLDPVLLKLSKG